MWPDPTEEALKVAPFHMILYYDVKRTALPNYMSLRRQVPSQLNCDEWDRRLAEYDDKAIVDFLRYGWPVSYTAPAPPVSTPQNHASALRHPDAVDKFIYKELSKEALLGPFENLPFSTWTQISPLMTRDKPDGSGKRVIVDLSFPQGRSVNDGIPKNFHQGEDFSYTLPSAQDLADNMLKAGRGCYMWKSDLERAYRQLRVDPLDYPLLAIRHKGATYVDICPSFGCRTSSSAQQRVSNAVTFLMKEDNYTTLAYVDDFCGVAPSLLEAEKSFAAFHSLTSDLGLALAKDKTFSPDTQMEWLGYHFDSNLMQITIPDDKMKEVSEELEKWGSATWATKTQLQSLAGKLNFIGNCVRPARRFINRILMALREANTTTRVLLSSDFMKDVAWFRLFAANFNRRLLIEPKLPCIQFECDACLKGCGGFSDSLYYDIVFPDHYLDQFHITQLEALNAVIAVKTLTPAQYTNGRVLIKTDNMGSVFALSTGKTRDPVLAACARELWLFSALRNIDILITHVPGEQLHLADALSRMSFDRSLHTRAVSLVTTLKLSRAKPVALTNVLSASL